MGENLEKKMKTTVREFYENICASWSLVYTDGDKKLGDYVETWSNPGEDYELDFHFKHKKLVRYEVVY